jgi:hypothetical protein
LNLEEFKIIVDHTVDNLHHKKANEVPVLITLSESSMGARASSNVKYANMGFDWEHGQFRIEPDISLVRKGNSLTDIKNVICRQYEGKNYYFCPRCQQKITKTDKYCRYCSQKLK